ncbi:GrpB family protein [Clostridium estertheticum]|uniref:GrpB family protein n=1 Tax=Clostridium estertheticum TaxID=238834 RepID=UPI001C6F0303|nr:GrpB family protein [Clostridium estertheticum]MBW9154621.1 GrpB family protein [Clostridium estertheticum]WLC86599.1 GrpB family protein [Clostridium estertheticum]
MKTLKVIVVPYDSNWNDEFIKIKFFLEKALENNIIAIEHVGSTSVEGLFAKPIIDIDVIIENYEKFDNVKSRLEKLGYYHEGDLGIKNREAFAYTEKHEFMTHHLYVCPRNSEELKRHITFRNYLRTHTEDREKYSAIKLQSALKYPTDIDNYCENKSPCIAEIYKKCGL